MTTKERQKKMKKKISKFLRAGAAVLMAGALCGCSVKFGTRKEPKLDKVVAWAEGGENADEMKVTYGEFRKQYMFVLVNSEIEDDTEASIADVCKQQRSVIINSIISMKIYAQMAKDMGIYELTEEEQKKADEAHEQTVESFIKQLGERVEQELEESRADSETSEETDTPGMTDEEKYEAGTERLNEILEKAGMDLEDMRQWEMDEIIVEKVRDAIYNSVDRTEAEKQFEDMKKEAQDYYNNDISKYNQVKYAQVWLPEGSRLIKHVLLEFDEETLTEINGLREEGKDDDADKLRSEKAEALKSKREEVEKKLEDGEKIDDLINEYSDDKSGSAQYPDGYTVIPKGTAYVKEFQEAAFVPEKIGDKTVCVSDYGVHIMVYVGDAKVSADDVDYTTDKLYKTLGEDELYKQYAEQCDIYAFEIDYDALRLDKPEEESSAVSE